MILAFMINLLNVLKTNIIKIIKTFTLSSQQIKAIIPNPGLLMCKYPIRTLT